MVQNKKLCWNMIYPRIVAARNIFEVEMKR